uniref:Uncharacterized protein n=1 Tax=uncultured prokaryote TaxID=198431 RepID=A0A0H5Q6H7_9ZZZZ|nr:hypothetical protein [uncultured prokaryote]
MSITRSPAVNRRYNNYTKAKVPQRVARVGPIGAQIPFAIRRSARGLQEVKARVSVNAINNVPGDISGSSSLSILSVIVPGGGNDDRDGNTLRFKGMQYAGVTYKPSTFADATSRLIIFRWDNYRAPTTADILVSPSVHSVYNQNSTKNYKIMVDRWFYSKAEVTTGANYATRTHYFNGSFKDDKVVTYDTDGGTTGDSKYYACFINDTTASTINTLTTTTWFVDV